MIGESLGEHVSAADLSALWRHSSWQPIKRRDPVFVFHLSYLLGFIL
jgi:hypothetical protein